MKKKFLTHCLLALWALMLSLASCDSTDVGTEQGDYVVAIEVDSLKCDSVSLVVVEPAYNALRSLGHRRLKNGKASFKGQIDSPRIAMLKLNRASKPFYFILEPCTTSITIDRQRIIVWGGKVNHEYFSHVRRRGRLIALGPTSQLVAGDDAASCQAYRCGGGTVSRPVWCRFGFGSLRAIAHQALMAY